MARRTQAELLEMVSEPIRDLFLGPDNDVNIIQEGIRLPVLSADPAEPPEGEAILWVSDGTGSGDAGDLMVKINGATTKVATIVDFSLA